MPSTISTSSRTGCPTEAFYDYYGKLPKATATQLRRLSKLHPSDWYFNRCLADVFIGYYYQVDRSRPRPKRTDKYWFNAGWKNLQKYQSLVERDPVASMEARGILLDADRPDVKALLRLRTVRTKGEFLNKVRDLYTTFEANYTLSWHFWAASSSADMDKALHAAESDKRCSALIRDAIRTHHAFFKACGKTPSSRPTRAS